jgi:HEAT repeat protein
MNRIEEEIAALIGGLAQAEKVKIRAAVDALIALSADYPVLRTNLERSLTAGQQKNRWAVAYVLGHLPQPSGAAIRALLDGLDHPEPDIRWAIALCLVRIANNEMSLVNLLLELCRNGTGNQRRMAVYCIRDLHLDDAASLQTLLAVTTDVEPTVRVAAVTSLKSRSGIDAQVRRRLLEIFLNDVEINVRNAAAITWAQLGSPDEEFCAALRAAQNSADGKLKKAASAALKLLESKRPASGDGSRSR